MRKQFLVTIENGEDIGEDHIADPLWNALDDYDYGSFTVKEIILEEENQDD